MPEPEQTPPTSPVSPPRRARRGKRGKLTTAVLAVCAFAVVAWLAVRVLWKEDPGESQGELTYTVKRGDLRISSVERGNVKALRSVPIYSSVEGVSTIVSLVPEGSTVKEGDVLVELDSSELQQQLNQQQIQVDTADASLLQSEKQLEIQKSLSESEIDKAKLDLELAGLDLEKYTSEKGEYFVTLMKSKADKMIAEEELRRDQNKLEWTKKLAERGYVTGTELIADQLAVKKAETQVEQSAAALELLDQYTHKKDTAKYKSAVKESEKTLDRAQLKAKAEITKAEADKKSKDSTLRLSRRRLEKIQDQIAKTKIKAPQDGMVVYANVEPWRRERMIMQGAEVRENQLLMNLPDVETMAVDVQVHESWVDQVKEGLPAFVSIDALPNLNLKGHVSKVGLLPDSVNRWLNPDLKVYQTEIILEDAPDIRLLKPGMSAKVDVLIAILNDVIFVPVQSVSTVDKEQVCYILDDGEFTAHSVKCGRYNDSFIEVVSGLKEGDVIELTAPAPRGSRMKEDDAQDKALAAEIQAAGAEGGARKRAGPGSKPQQDAGPQRGPKGKEGPPGREKRREGPPEGAGTKKEASADASARPASPKGQETAGAQGGRPAGGGAAQ